MTPFTGQYTTVNEERKAQRPNDLDADLIGLRPIYRRKTSSFFLGAVSKEALVTVTLLEINRKGDWPVAPTPEAR